MQPKIDITQIDTHEWTGAFDSCGTSNFFFSIDWLQFQAELFNLENLFFKVSVENKQLFISFQKKNHELFSNFIAYGGFMTNDNAIIDSKLLFSVIDRVAEQSTSRLTRLKTYPLLNNQSNSVQNIQMTAILKLNSNLEKQNNLINKKNRYEIKKAISHGIYIKQLSFSDLKLFYSLYLLTMIRVESKYLSPQQLFEYCFKSSNCLVLGAYYEDELVAGSIFALCGTGIYHWFSVSSEKGRETGANYLIINTIIKKGIVESYSFINLGSSHSESILKPKLRWGARLVKYIGIEN